MEEKKEIQLELQPDLSSGPSSGHEKHCFVIMPSGRDPEEQKWFRGWYEVVIRVAVQESGYEPILAASEEQPGAINDEIRAHLALDPMVVVDLGGAEPEDDPNPNVMYELGIRHALGLPLVMLAWKGQRLPFDVSNQRVIMEERDLLDLDHNKKKLVSFIHAANQGKYYRPMEAVARLATIQAASTSLTEDSVLRALVQEVRDLRSTLAVATERRDLRKARYDKLTVKRLLMDAKFRKDLYPHFMAIGGTASEWPRILRTPISPSVAEQMRPWSAEQWKTYIESRVNEFSISIPPSDLETKKSIDENLLNSVREVLPSQPWPDGVHHVVMEKLNMTKKEASLYINELISRGIFMRQVDGQLFPTDEDG